MVTVAPIIAVLDDEPEMRKALCGLAAVLYALGIFEALRRRAREGGGYLVRTSLARNCCWVQDFGLFPDSEVRGAGLPEHMMTAPGLQATLRPEFELPTVKSTGPLGELAVLPSQVELSEFKLGPRFSGDPNGASKLDGFVFTRDQESGDSKRANQAVTQIQYPTTGK